MMLGEQKREDLTGLDMKGIISSVTLEGSPRLACTTRTATLACTIFLTKTSNFIHLKRISDKINTNSNTLTSIKMVKIGKKFAANATE
jgi:hypothetical protein